MHPTVLLLTFLLLLLPFPAGCGSLAEKSPPLIQYSEPDPLPEGYHYVASRYFDGFSVIVEVETLRPVVLEAYGVQALAELDLERLKTWRNRHGRPWTTWVYENDLTLATKEAHTTRAYAGSFFIPEKAYLTFLDFALEQEGIDLSPEERSQLLEGWPWPEKVTRGNTTYPDYFITRWYRQNTSASVHNILTAIEETFTWITSPDYEKGTLPAELEAVIEEMRKGEVGEQWLELTPDFNRMAVRASEIVRDASVPQPSQRPAAGTTELRFFALPTLPERLTFAEAARGAISQALENPAQLEGSIQNLSVLLHEAPAAIPEAELDLLGFQLETMKTLSGMASVPDHEIIEETGAGPLSAEENRARLRSYLADHVQYLEDTIKVWTDIIAENQLR